MWRFWICNSLTGVRLREVFPADGSWKTLMNGVGSGSHSFSLFDEVEVLVRAGFSRDAARAEVKATWSEFTDPDGWLPAVVVCWEDVPVYAGLVQRRENDDATGIVTVHHVEVRALLNSRLTHPVGGFGTGDWAITNKDMRTAASEVIRKAAGNRGPRWDVRWTAYTPVSGSYSRQIKAYEQQTGEQILAEIQNAENGPDIHIRPRWRDTDQGLEWEDRRGSPRLTGGSYEFIAGADNGTSDLKFVQDAKRQVTGVHVAGKGSEIDMRRGWAAESAPTGKGWLLDHVLPMKHVSDVGLLTSHGRAYELAHKYPTTQFQVSLRADGAPDRNGMRGPTAAEILPGTTVRVNPGSRSLILPDRWFSGYVIGVSGDMGLDLKLDFQEV
ncbi:hypothetical protein [Pseudoclavibacter helvolus]|uniref:hypothetical protein n=1 Tax=Pseudoclavibacter helvolus TaxID=255205 RepID=UPI003C72E018